jgi:hypothetical protein
MKRILLFALVPFLIQAKVLFITHSYNRPDFIELQAKTFKAFLQDEYEFVVFNDAPQENMRRQIQDKCSQLEIRCFRVPQNLHKRGDAGSRHIDGIMYSLETIGYDYDGIVALIDSDMFLLKSFCIEKYLDGYGIAGQLQGRENDSVHVTYISPALAFMDMRILPNKKTLSFQGGKVEGITCDVGAHSYYYFKNNPTISPRLCNLLHIGAWKAGILCKSCNDMTCNACVRLLKERMFDDAFMAFIQRCPDDIEFFMDNTFLHYRSGSNWNNKPASYHQAKTAALSNLMATIL